MANDLEQQAMEVLEPLGYEVLELDISGHANKRRLLLRIDRLDGQQVGMEDVTQATRVFGLELDRLDPFTTPYQLEVESPGPERPLKTAKHFNRFINLLVKVKTPQEAFKGRVIAVSEVKDGEAEEQSVTFEIKQKSDISTKILRLSEISSARLAEWPKEPR